MYKNYALAILAGERKIENLKGIMRERVQIELDKLNLEAVAESLTGEEVA